MLEWFSVQIDFVLSPEFLDFPPEDQAAWLRAHALAARTGGVIEGLRTWSKTRLSRSAGLSQTRCERLVALKLAWFQGDDLHVAGFNRELAGKARARSQRGVKGAESRWTHHEQASRKHDDKHMPTGAASIPTSTQQAYGEVEGEEERERYPDPDARARGPSAGSGSRTTRPRETGRAAAEWTYPDPRTLSNIAAVEADLIARGEDIPWRDDPRRLAMTHDVFDRPVPPLTPSNGKGHA